MMELESKWIIWQNSNDDSNVKSWGEDLVNVGEFKEVPEFMYVADKIEEVGVENLSSLKIFKKGIKPMWEDPMNLNGGRLVVDIPVINRHNINLLWITTVAFCISNEIGGICGCVFSEKNSTYKISIWIDSEGRHKEIINKWREKLNLNEDSYYFLSHKKSLDVNKSKKKWGNKSK